MDILAGTVNAEDGSGQRRRVKQAIVHKEYGEGDEGTWQNDIALLQIHPPYQRVATSDGMPLIDWICPASKQELADAKQIQIVSNMMRE